MKLLSPLEARDKAKRSVDSEKHRLVEVQSLITQKYQELASVEATFDETMQKQRNQWAAEQMEHEARIVSLRKITEELEERKAQALLPLTQRAKELDTKASALDAREAKLDDKQADLMETSDLLKQRLDDVAEREIQADRVAKMLTVRDGGIAAQAAQVTLGSATLNAAIAKASSDAAKRERAVTLKEAALQAKEDSLLERERKVDGIVSSLDKREAKILDDRFALEQAAKEIQAKQN